MWKRRRISTVNHISRLPFDNPARIILFGEPILYLKNNTKKRRFRTVKETVYKDIDECLENKYYCNLCDRKFKRVGLHQTQNFS